MADGSDALHVIEASQEEGIEKFAVFLNHPRPLQRVRSGFSSGFSSRQPQNYRVSPSTVIT